MNIYKQIIEGKYYNLLNRHSKSQAIKNIAQITGWTHSTVSRHLNDFKSIPTDFKTIRVSIYAESIIRELRTIEQKSNQLNDLINMYDLENEDNSESCQICGSKGSFNILTGNCLCDEHFQFAIKQILTLKR